MLRKTVLRCAALGLLLAGVAPVCSKNKNHLAVSLGLLQSKDQFNQSMIYRGPIVALSYQRVWDFSTVELSYSAKMGVGVPLNRGMVALHLDFVPVDLSCLVPVYRSGGHLLKIGGNFGARYSYQSYPDFQNARLFWCSELGVAPVLEYRYRWNNHTVGLAVQNSLFGFVGRTNDYHPYFYSFRWSDFFTSPHTQMQFGSFDKYNRTHVQVEYTSGALRTHRFSIGLEYVDVRINAHYQSLCYFLQWRKTF